ncbi:MerC domain-containing protein [Granulicella sibirica]|uniref:MerC domain-containing protein n=1 Tax=Granulicella sibirica TaxID=2479048 RepID=UPI001F4F9EB9|nr:MerC domain-containing protein [Granulicella sibirica]
MSSGTNASFITPGSRWPDGIGQCASALCVVHCLLTPVLLSMSAVAAHFLPSEESTHRCLAVGVAAIGALALANGYRVHGRKLTILMMCIGLSLVATGAFYGDLLPGHWVEVGVTLTGSLFMIASHRINHTFCKDCVCATANEHP